MYNHIWIPRAGIDYYKPRTKEDAVVFLSKYWSKSVLMKKPIKVVFAIYHRKMKDVLIKREIGLWRKKQKVAVDM